MSTVLIQKVRLRLCTSFLDLRKYLTDPCHPCIHSLYRSGLKVFNSCMSWFYTLRFKLYDSYKNSLGRLGSIACFSCINGCIG
jgi:hypothetical protein